jgi:hypothetical protein
MIAKFDRTFVFLTNHNKFNSSKRFKTTLENKILLGSKRKRCKVSNMGCYFFVRDCRDCEKTIEYPQLPLRNLAIH